MSAKKRRLGRGLDALLGEVDLATKQAQELKQLPIDLIERGRYQPRTRMDKASLNDLARSIKARGVIQPIVVRPLATGNYEIVAGERRWRAAQIAGLDALPVMVRDVPDEAAMAIALIENIQREDLSPVEEATGLRRLLDEFGLTHEQIAQGIGRSRSAVTNMLRLLTLSPKARRLLEDGKIEMGHARALLTLSGATQDRTANEVVNKGLSVRQTEAWVKRLQTKTKGRSKSRRRDPDVQRLEQELSDRLGAKVSIQHTRGKGRLVIQYHSLDELDGILRRIR